MDFKNFNDIDLKLHLLSGNSIKVDNLELTPYTLREINNYGYSNYMTNLQWIVLSVDDFINSTLDLENKMFLESQKTKLKTFDFYIKLGGSNIQKTLLDALSMIFKTDDVRIIEEKESVVAIDFIKSGIYIEDENGELSINKERLDSISENEIKIVHRDNFDDIVKIVKLQNYMSKPFEIKKQEINPVDDETRELMEHMERMRKKVEEIKRKQQQQEGNDEDIDISDIISAVSSKSNSINKINIWQLTMYQLYDEYSRLELIDSYDFSIRAMMAGAEKVDLKHWSSKI